MFGMVIWEWSNLGNGVRPALPFKIIHHHFQILFNLNISQTGSFIQDWSVKHDNMHCVCLSDGTQQMALRKKCPYSELFW